LEGTINCATSKRFVDCLTGFEYFSSEVILDSFGNPILPDYVYGGLVNGVQSCFIYVDLVDNISGVDKIEITAEFGPENEGSCIFCNFPTPTPTPTILPSEICFTIGGETPGGLFNCLVTPEIGLINGKPYYKAVLDDCVTQFDNYYIWFSTSGDYANTWVVSELNNATIGNVFSYISSVAGEYPIGTWDQEPQDMYNILQSQLNSCPTLIMCFDVITECVDCNSWQCSIPFTGYYNGKPYYILLDNDCLTSLGVFVWWNSSLNRWEVSDSLGGGELYLYNNNPSNYPETNSTYSWIDVGAIIYIIFSVQGTCPTPTPTPTPTPSPTPVPINPICQSCDVGFDFYDINPISVISVGVVTASCDPSITDYVIEWYGPGVGSTNLVFTSGLGTDYVGDYLYTHPLTGTSEVPVVAGIYTPVISKIKINGTEYTNLNCFNTTTVDVNALTCTNGNNSNLPQYSHKLEFSATVGQTPQTVSTTYILDPTKPYFAIQFDGQAIYDTLKITFFGSSYSDPITIEYLSLGADLTETNFDLSLLPKTAKPGGSFPIGFVRKVLNLNNFTINSGDYLIIDIIPNQLNTNTNWKFYCTCLETIDCNVCDDNNISQPFKIVQSSINSNLITCDRNRIDFDFSACTSSDFLKYMVTNGSFFGTAYNDSYYFNSFSGVRTISPLQLSGCSITTNTIIKICATPSTSTITFNKSVVSGQGLIAMTFTDINDLATYYNNWQSTYMTYSGSPFNCNDVDYYRYFNLSIPLASGSQNCGDTTGYQGYLIHPSAIVTSGGTGPWNMTITMPTISECITFDSCQVGCQNDEYNIVTSINASSTGSSNNITIVSNTGSKLLSPITSIVRLGLSISPASAVTFSDFMSIPKYINQTIPYSGISNTLITSLSAETCSFNDWNFVSPFGIPSKNLTYYNYYAYYYELRAINPLNYADYEIWAPTFSNGVWVGYPSAPTLNLIYRYVGGSVTFIDNNYFV
jgi:hypothetical protein